MSEPQDPILRDVPTFFETERLHIRAAEPGDGEKVERAVKASQAHIRPWLSFAVNPASAIEYEILMRRWQVEFLGREEFKFLIFRKGHPNEMIGSVGLHRIDWKVPKVEIGYWIHVDYARQGYTTEAAAGIEAFAITHFDPKRIEILCDAENLGSAAVARKLGYPQEARMRNWTRHFEDNSLRDFLLFAKAVD